MKKSPMIVIQFFIISVLIALTTSCKKSDENNPAIIKDGDGNIYTSITIGTQVWLVENLKTTKLNDGTQIPLVTDFTEWTDLATMGYCWYMNDEATYKSDYGALYNWYAVDTRKLCPQGWHIPNEAEWTTLSTFLGDADAGQKMKEIGTTHWDDPNIASNQSGFKARGAGYRNITSEGSSGFEGIRIQGYWWSTKEYSSSQAMAKFVAYSTAPTYWGEFYKRMGFSVRCIKD